MKIFEPIVELSAGLERHPGGHNWPDMEIVVDRAKRNVVDDEIYLIRVRTHSGPEVKRLRNHGEGSLWLHPAVATVHGHSTVEAFGRRIPCTSIEFSDSIYRRNVEVLGLVVGIWAGATP